MYPEKVDLNFIQSKIPHVLFLELLRKVVKSVRAVPSALGKTNIGDVGGFLYIHNNNNNEIDSIIIDSFCFWEHPDEGGNLTNMGKKINSMYATRNRVKSL